MPAGAIRKRFVIMKSDKSTATPKSEAKSADTPATPAPAPEQPEPTAVEKALAESVEAETDGLDGFQGDKDVAVAFRRLAKALGDHAKPLLGVKDPEPVEKADPLASIPEAARAIVKAAFDKAESLTKQLEAAQEEKEVREAVEKAAKAFPNIPGKAQDLGVALRAVRKADAKAADVIEAALTAANKLAEKGLEPVGKSDPTNEAGKSPIEKLNDIAAAKVVQSAGKLSLAKAFDQALVENPDLYAAYEADKKGKG